MKPNVDGNDILPHDLSTRQAGDGDRFLEVEVKFMLRDLDAFRRRLADVGAEIVAPRVFERNVRFDTADAALLARQQLLRLRQDTRVRLTFKGPVAEDVVSEAKVREEIELEVGDFDRMSAVLQRLGFLPVQIYEKYRETYQWRDVEIVLDEMPFGNFIELEGPGTELKPVAEALGLDWSRRILANYLALMELCRQSFDLPFSDLTFENFVGLSVDMGELLPVCTLQEVEE